MPDFGELELWHQRHMNLMREAANDRLARRVREAHPLGASRVGSAVLRRVSTRFPHRRETA
jgi:hypothetical protein